MKSSFRVTPRAFDDMKNIARYTRKKWGAAQRDRYLGALNSRFSWLAEHPDSGKHRPDVCDGYHCFPQGSHLIFYLVRADGIDIIGVPHKRMDVALHLGASA